MIEVVEQLHEQRMSGVASAHKSDYRWHVERDNAQLVVGEELFKIASHGLGIWIPIDHDAAFASRILGERFRFRSRPPGWTDDDETAAFGEILQQFSLG